MSKRRAFLLGCGAVGWALSTACSANHFVQRGADLYGEGRYVEADEVFERSEPRIARAPLEARAAYAAYRGANFMALGDFEHAERWLSLASAIEHDQPGTLSRRERRFLENAWHGLHRHQTQTSPEPAATAIASTALAPGQSSESEPPSVSPTRRALIQQ